MAITVEKENAKRFKNEHPEAAKSILEFTLVDDTLRSINDERELEKLSKDLVFIYDQIGMELRKFASNSKRVMESIPIEKRAPAINMDKFHHNVESIYNRTKAFWMIWLCDSDQLQYKLKELDLKQKWTRRTTASVANGVYDSMGMIAPVIIRGRKLVQEILISTTSWDQVFEGELSKEWSHFAEGLRFEKDINIKTYRDEVCENSSCI